MAPNQPVMRLADVGEAVRRRWRVVVVVVVAALAAAVGLTMAWPEKYTATAIVSVSPITADPFNSGPNNQQINMATEQQVVSSTEIATAAAEQIGNAASPRDLVDSVSVTSPSDSQILQIRFSSGTSAQAAADGANAFADAYLKSRGASADMLAERIIDTLEQRIEELTEESDDDAAVQQQIAELRQQQSSLLTVAINPGQVIEAATPPSSPSSPSMLVTLAAGLVAGLLVGVAVALLRDRNDRRVTHAGRLQDLVGGVVIDGTADPDPDEAYRHALLELTRSHPSDRAGRADHADRADHAAASGQTDPGDNGRPLLVALVGPADGRVYEAGASLIDVAHNHRLRARLIDSDRMDMSAVDAGWPAEADVVADWADDDLIVLDLTMIASRTRRIAIALRCDAVIVAAAKRSRRQPIHEFAQQLAAADRSVDLGLLLPDSSRRRKPDRATGTVPAERQETQRRTDGRRENRRRDDGRSQDERHENGRHDGEYHENGDSEDSTRHTHTADTRPDQSGERPAFTGQVGADRFGSER